MAPFTPVEFTKNGRTEVADDPGQYAQYLWEGWTRAGAPPADPASIKERLADVEAELTGRLSDVALRAAFGRRAMAAGLLGRLTPLEQPTPAVAASPPTITWQVDSRTLTGHLVNPVAPNVALLGYAATLNVVGGTWDIADGAGEKGIEFVHTGQELEFGWRSPTNPVVTTWIWVDGQPLSAAPEPQALVTGPGQWILGRMDFGSVGTRRVTIRAGYPLAWLPIGIEPTATISAPPRRPRIAMIGDSFLAGSDGTQSPHDLPPSLASLLMGAEVVNCGLGGSGYTTGTNTFGSAARRAQAASAGPVDALIFVGSVNDGDAANLQAAAIQCFADYATDFPDVPVIVFGPEASGDADTVSAARASAMGKVKAAADASPNVIAFFDMIGTLGGAPAAFDSGAAYDAGDRVTHLGAVWERAEVPPGWSYGSPGSSADWHLVTWDYWGSGKVGSPTGVGSRDVLLHSDGVHPTTAASRLLGRRIAAGVRQALSDFAALR